MKPTVEQVAAEAYQVIGALVDEEKNWYAPGVQKALDYFGGIAAGEEPTRCKRILPWDLYGTRI